MLCEDVPIHVIVPHRIIAVGALHLLMVVFLGPKEMKKNLGQIGSDWVRLWVRLGQIGSDFGSDFAKKVEARTSNFPEHPENVVHIFGKLRLWLFLICAPCFRSLLG